MNREPDNLTTEQRALLGERAADELARDERWLAGRLGEPKGPAGLSARLAATVAGELAARSPVRHVRTIAWAAAAAMLLAAGGVALMIFMDRPNQTPVVTDTPPRPVAVAEMPNTVAQANVVLDRYLDSVDEDVVDFYGKVDSLRDELNRPTDPYSGDWVAQVFEESAG